MNASNLSLYEYTSEQLRNLCEVVDFDKSDNTPIELLKELLGPAGERSLADSPLWPSDVSDDGTPIEFSVAFDDSGDRAIRILAETIAERPSASANARAARRFLDVIAERLQLSVDRFTAIQDLFLPERPRGKFALWYSLILRPNSPPKLKIYFNPEVRGAEQAPQLVAEGLRRLGLDSAYDTVAEHALLHGERDRFCFFALDLDNGPLSRVKLYISHNSAESKDVERAASAVDGADPLRIREFCTLIGGGSGPFTGRPLVSSYSFTESDTERPGNYSLYLPIRDYVPDDESARSRVLALMQQCHLDQNDLDRALRAVSKRPLRDGVGLIAHVSLRLGRFGPGTTVYFSAEAFRVAPPQERRPPVDSPPSAKPSPSIRSSINI